MDEKKDLINSWFDALHERRKTALGVFLDPEYISVFNGVIDKYCDSAHFIYELLQNADDAMATEVEMVLTKDRFIFTHNGSIRFTISDPAKVQEDRQQNHLGHINSITAIGFSNKNQIQTNNLDEIKIGKFGVGFKAVFQYTTTPYIYDDPFCFKIENYIVPTKLKDTTLQRHGKTVFVFPFDRKEISPEQAYKDIEQKITSLVHPQLFLYNIQSISWTTPTDRGKIEKKLIEQYDTYNDIVPAYYEITNSKSDSKRIILMTQKVSVPETYIKHTIAIGYFIDEKGQIDVNTHPNINCFFPTQENIETCYIIHAPFALVDNRQQIKRNNFVNESLINKIGELAADSIVILKDISIKTERPLLGDNIFDLIHHNLSSIKEDSLYSWRHEKHYDFAQYYERVFDKHPVFLSRQKKYITKRQGLWGDEKMRGLFSSKQLDSLICGKYNCSQINDDHHSSFDFILCSLNTRYKALMERYSVRVIDDIVLANKLNSNFLKAQSNEWLSKLYKYILDNRLVENYQLNKRDSSSAPMRDARIIKNECGDFVAPYKNGHLNIFFQTPSISDPTLIINSELYDSNEDFRNLIAKLEVEEPSEFDKIQLLMEKDLDKESHNKLLSTIIRYYITCDKNEGEKNKLIELLKERLTLYCKEVNGDTNSAKWCTISEICDDSRELIDYYTLAKISEKYYIDRDYYCAAIKEVGERNFNLFIESFCFQAYPQVSIESTHLTDEEFEQRPYKYEDCHKGVRALEGLEIVLKNIAIAKEPKRMSHFIWNSLIQAVNKYGDNLFVNDRGEYFYYTQKEKMWQTCSLKDWLRKYKWLFVNGELSSLEDGVYREDIILELYENNDLLFANLEIEPTPRAAEKEAINQMSEETQMTFSMGKTAQKYARTEEELNELLYRGKAAKAAEERRRENVKPLQNEANNLFCKRKDSNKLSKGDFDESTDTHNQTTIKPEFKAPVSMEEALSGFEDKASLQREEIESVMTLRETAENTEKYSYGWIKALMSLEAKSCGTESVAGRHSIYILFNRVVADQEFANRIILSEPSRSIPNMLEDIDGIPVTLYFLNGEKQTITFESASVKENALIIRGGASMVSIIESITKNISLIGRATIDVDKPVELVKRWERLIENLPFETDEELVKANLRTDLKFIFGPPGTGKTTTLAKRIIDLMSNNKQCRILVLAPTNKACDVLAKKILNFRPDNDQWLWRFVTTMDSELENEEVVYQRDSDVMRQKQVCVISTIARYSYDGFDTCMLSAIDWDYVIIDEASMIPLYQILPPLFNEHCGKIWIAGDPFQIEPIVNIDLWKGENIYTMINLCNFVNPETSPVNFDVELLMTQYRSIPVIGELYSQYMYGGKLIHNRSASSHKQLNMGLNESPLNIISFPVNKDSIFDTRRLLGSNIHIYSVLFTVEFLKHITLQISTNQPDEMIKIGVVGPYGIEIQAIQKLYNQTCESYANVLVDFGTSHGFQGDQCDIVIAVMNPPSSGLKRYSEITFINKPNILNVAISRAKDYLFLLIPEKEYDLFQYLTELKRLGKIMVSTKCNTIYTSDEVERIMFGKSHHIEEQTYVTTHQTTNIYSDPMAKYEVRIDEKAIDIQINNIP